MYKQKLTPEEALKAIKLRMNYKVGETLTENLESSGIISEQSSASEIAKIANNVHSIMSGDVETEDLEDLSSILTSSVFGKTMQDGSCVLQKVMDYYGKSGFFGTRGGGLFGSGDLVKDITNSTEMGEAEFEDVKKELLDKINKELSSFCKSGKKDTTDKKDGKKTTTTTTTTTSVPAELKDIKAFQDWLDKNHAGWATGYKDGKIEQGKNGGGYGSFGPRTSKAWNQYKDEYLKGSNPTIKPDDDVEIDVDVNQM